MNYTYDALNRPLTVSFTPPDTAQNFTFTYDEVAALHGRGRLTSLTDAGGGISWQYDALGSVTRESRTTDGIAYDTVYTYNDRSEITGITYPTGTQVTVQRYDNGEVSGILIDGQPATQNLSYLPFGPEEDFVFGNNLLTVDRTYADGYFRISRINAQVLDYQYEYYVDGSVKSIDGITEPEITRGRTEYVNVNGNNRLDYVTRPDSSVCSYVHDNSGRITSDGVYTYSYNPLGRLIKVEQGATTVAEYAYDPFGRRIKKTVSGITTHFHYDLQGRLIAETAGDGTALRDYIYQNGNLVAIKLHSTQAGVYYVISDHLGTPQQIVDAAGTVVWKAAFLPFGKAQVLTETIVNNIRFPGQYFDAETGLHYNWNRYYDPDTGRYLTPDPIGLDGGLNLYAYVAGDPVNIVDPWGLRYAESWGAGGVAVGSSIVLGGSIVVDAATGGLNILATPAEVAGGAALGGTIGYGLGSALDWMMNEADECNDDSNPAQDKYLGKRDEKKLKKKLAEEGETIEGLKTAGGKGAGGYDLYVKPNGDIVTKPKGGKGPSEPTGWNISEL